eukprot:TCALIF_11621-PA protein Name:"Similar to Trabd2b Metalloprotease TIKI2 (Mus musculus)" AED:0.12 eAED:0.12 QI:0/0.75/0.8/1/0.75/0.8/5/188/491
MRAVVGWGGARLWLMVLIGSLRPPWGASSSPESDSLPSSSFLWQIQATPPSYFFGTIHVPYTRVWDAVPSNAKQAFKYSNQIYFELDLTHHGTLTALSYCQLLPPNQHLSQVIPSELFLRLKHHLAYVRRSIQHWITPDQIDRGLTADYIYATMTSNWERKQPVWVMMMLNSLTKSDIASRGIPVLDLFLQNQAEKKGKKIGAIEKVQEQCQPLNQLSHAQVIIALNQTLTAQEKHRLGLTSTEEEYSTDNLIRQYRRGDFQPDFFNRDTFQIPKLSGRQDLMSLHDQKTVQEIDRFFHDELILKRNKRMAARVIDLLMNQPNSYFFAFGAGHFLGNDSILSFVKSAGFHVKRIDPDQTLDFSYAFSASPNAKNKVQGTFDDLPEHEKKRALLKFIQYHQQQERENDTRRFGEMMGSESPITPNPLEGPEAEEEAPTPIGIDEKAIEESLKIWYGINERSLAHSGKDKALPMMISVILGVMVLASGSSDKL